MTTPNMNPGTNVIPPSQQPVPTPQQPVDNELINNHQNRENIINEILGMGFQRAEIEQALAAAFYDKERAVDYLLNGIPENILSDLSGKQVLFFDQRKKGKESVVNLKDRASKLLQTNRLLQAD